VKKPYPIHPDYKKIPRFNFSFHPWLMRFFNTLIKLLRKTARARTADVAHNSVQVRGGDGAVFNLITLTPESVQKPAPVLLYFHGGAFALTYTSSQLRVCEHYARKAQCVVVYVDYRLAPDYPFPHGFNDCYAALEWTRTNAATLGLDSSRIAVMGDSAGGAFAAGVAQKALDSGIPVCAQLLIYPVLDSECKTASATEFVDVPLWNAVSNRRMWQMYLKNFHGTVPAYAAPGQRINLSGLPPTYIETAEFDPLRDEGRAYATALQDQGVVVELHETKGTIHGFEVAANNQETISAYPRRIQYLIACFSKPR
jgi:acetyl esterase